MFRGFDFKDAQSENLDSAPDCSENPFADFSSAKDWNVKRGENVARGDKLARPN